MQPDLIFSRIEIDYVTLGGTRVQWEMDEHFREPGPWVFQVQVAEADISTSNWSNVGSPVTNECQFTDPNQEYWGKQQNAFYRVQIKTALNNVYYSQPQNIMGKLDFKTWGYAQELVRKEYLRLAHLKVGIRGIFLKAKRSGDIAVGEVDPFTGDVIDSLNADNFAQRWQGGYYYPVPCIFGDVNPVIEYPKRSLQDGRGTVNDKSTTGIFLASPFMTSNDVWIDATSDLRYWVHEVKVLTHVRGVPLITLVELRPVPTTDIIYKFKLPPLVVNLALQDNFGMHENIQRLANARRVFSDKLGAANNTTRIANAIRQISDNLGLSTNQVAALVWMVVIADNIAAHDSVANYRNISSTVSDFVGVTTLIQNYRNIARQISDNLAATDATARVANALRAITNNMGVTDNVSRVANATRITSTTMGVSDNVNRVLDLTRTIVDSIGSSDNLARVANAARHIADSLAATDTNQRIVSVLRLIADAVGLQEALSVVP